MKNKSKIGILFIGIFAINIFGLTFPAQAFGFHTVWGYVTNASGANLGGVTVTLTIAGSTAGTDVTSSNGRFDITGDAIMSIPGPATVKYTKSGFYTKSISYTASPGSTVQKSTSLTPVPPPPPPPPAEPLAGRWKLDEINLGVQAQDSSTYQNHASITSMYETGITGVYDTAYTFWGHGGGDYIQVPRSTSLEPSSALTLSAWVRPSTNTDGYSVIIDKAHTSHSSPYYSYHLRIDNDVTTGKPNSLLFWIATTSVNYPLSVPFTYTNTWHLITATYDGQVMKIFVDGAQVSSRTASGTIRYATTDLFIGKFKNLDSGDFAGDMDDVRIYNTALTESEVANLMPGDKYLIMGGVKDVSGNYITNQILFTNVYDTSSTLLASMRHSSGHFAFYGNVGTGGVETYRVETIWYDKYNDYSFRFDSKMISVEPYVIATPIFIPLPQTRWNYNISDNGGLFDSPNLTEQDFPLISKVNNADYTVPIRIADGDYSFNYKDVKVTTITSVTASILEIDEINDGGTTTYNVRINLVSNYLMLIDNVFHPTNLTDSGWFRAIGNLDAYRGRVNLLGGDGDIHSAQWSEHPGEYSSSFDGFVPSPDTISIPGAGLVTAISFGVGTAGMLATGNVGTFLGFVGLGNTLVGTLLPSSINSGHSNAVCNGCSESSGYFNWENSDSTTTMDDIMDLNGNLVSGYARHVQFVNRLEWKVTFDDNSDKSASLELYSDFSAIKNLDTLIPQYPMFYQQQTPKLTLTLSY